MCNYDFYCTLLLTNVDMTILKPRENKKFARDYSVQFYNDHSIALFFSFITAFL